MFEFIAQYWLEMIFGVVTSILGLAYKKLSKRVKEQDAIKLGIQALLRDRIIATHNQYAERGFCPIYALENIEALYLQYHALGGNGTATKLVNDLKILPTQNDEKE